MIALQPGARWPHPIMLYVMFQWLGGDAANDNGESHVA